MSPHTHLIFFVKERIEHLPVHKFPQLTFQVNIILVRQVEQVLSSLTLYGFFGPILVYKDNRHSTNMDKWKGNYNSAIQFVGRKGQWAF